MRDEGGGGRREKGGGGGKRDKGGTREEEESYVTPSYIHEYPAFYCDVQNDVLTVLSFAHMQCRWRTHGRCRELCLSGRYLSGRCVRAATCVALCGQLDEQRERRTYVSVLDFVRTVLMMTCVVAVEVSNVARDRKRMFACGMSGCTAGVWCGDYLMSCGH